MAVLALFQDKGRLGDFLAARHNRVRSDIDVFPADRLLNESEVDLVATIVGMHSLVPPSLIEGDIRMIAPTETTLDVSDQPGRDSRWDNRRIYVRASQYGFEVPFTGQAMLFRHHPAGGFTMYPRATLYEAHLVLTYTLETPNAGTLKAAFDRDIDLIKRWLEQVRRDVEEYNGSLERVAVEAIARRKERLLADRATVAALGIPLKERPGESSTYAMPELRRKVQIAKPSESRVSPPAHQPFVPEPTVEKHDYEEILDTLDNMALMMERNPGTFSRIKEEALRDHFLVQLNARWDAGGETFNNAGKTDILLRTGGRAAFIAECKFWRGPKTVTESLDQLLSYLAWRDTKAALLLFVRNRPLSSVVARVPELAEAHPRHKVSRGARGESGFRYVFGQANDPSRDIVLTVMLFAVPGKADVDVE